VGDEVRWVVVPGIDNSDEDHWQSLWEAGWGPSARRIAVASWSAPELDDWCAAVERAVRLAGERPVVLVAHSLGTIAATHWLASTDAQVAGVLLVSPPDRYGTSFPAAAPTFAAVAAERLSVPGLLVSADNDPYCRTEVAEELAVSWGVPRIGVGPLGHLNSASGLGRWDAGRDLLTAFTAGLGFSSS
jgi:predicted alpha/beta hydrolase family esterase